MPKTPMEPTVRARQEQRIAEAINRRIKSGRPFTTDSVWDRLDDIIPGDHREWLGQHIGEAARLGRIEFVEWRVTPRSVSHARPVKVWKGVPASERLRRLEEARSVSRSWSALPATLRVAAGTDMAPPVIAAAHRGSR